MKSVKVTVFGKVLISGEHSVVYGEPALVASIDKRMEIELVEFKGYRLVSEVEDGAGLVRRALALGGVDPNGVKVKIWSEIPSGMGSSAAVSAGVIKAAYKWQGKKLGRQKWHELAWKAERLVHGNSSGVDPAAVIFGGLLWYVRGREIGKLKLKKPYRMVLVETGKPAESTGEMVSFVAERMKIYDLRFKKIVTELGKVSMKIREVMRKRGEIKDLMNENGVLLEELGVVGEKAIKISEKLRSMGWGVKITGAGGVKAGSGRLVVVGAELKTIRRMGYEAFEVKVGGDG